MLMECTGASGRLEREFIPEGVEETNNALPVLGGLKFTVGVQFIASRAVGVLVLMQVFPVLFFHQVDQVYASAIRLPSQQPPNPRADERNNEE